MKKPPAIDLNTAYADAHGTWRVTKLLADGVHVSLVQVDDPSRRKTLSAWALSDSRRFVRRPVVPGPVDEALLQPPRIKAST